MTRDELELRITQSLDGLLPPAEQAELDLELARDPDARQLLREYQNLNLALQSAPLPAIDYERLSQKISDLIGEAEAEPAPSVVYSFAWRRAASAGLALAACAAIAFGLWHAYRPAAPGSSPAPTVVAENTSPKPEPKEQPQPLRGQAIVQVTAPISNPSHEVPVAIGPSSGVLPDLAAREADEESGHRAFIAIDSAVPPAQDTDRLPY